MEKNNKWDKEVEEMARILAVRKGCVALTGAGISVASGIPDFRSPQGLWEKFDPQVYATLEAWVSSPAKAWELFRAVGKMVKNAMPNPAHISLGKLENMGIMDAVITQNVDGLHQLGGSKNVIEFHGNTREIICQRCEWKAKENESMLMFESEGVPLCPECGFPLRPRVVLFGEPIPEESLSKAMEAISKCKSLIVIGTSAVVAPASYLPYQAKRMGCPILEINLDSTPVSQIADISIRGSAEKILPEVIEKINIFHIPQE
jgi:NAD-dependent deacetylase